MDDDVGVTIPIVIMALLPHIAQRYTGVLSCIIKGCIDKEISNAECVNINFCVVLQIVPNTHRIVFLFETAQEAELKAIRFHLHILFDESKRGILNHRLYGAPRITRWVCPNIIISGEIDVRQPIQFCVKASGVDRAKHIVAIIPIGLNNVCDMFRIQPRLATGD